MIGIYKITNKINGISYIGQSRDIEKDGLRIEQDINTEQNIIKLFIVLLGNMVSIILIFLL